MEQMETFHMAFHILVELMEHYRIWAKENRIPAALTVVEMR
jgi:uncharacterized protein YbdZ (MbtH family)